MLREFLRKQNIPKILQTVQYIAKNLQRATEFILFKQIKKQNLYYNTRDKKIIINISNILKINFALHVNT